MKKSVMYAISYLIVFILMSGVFVGCHLQKPPVINTEEQNLFLYKKSPGSVASESDESWPMLYHDPQHTGFSSSEAPDNNITVWKKDLAIYSSLRNPIVAEEKLYVEIGGVFLSIYDVFSGETLGSIPIQTSSAVAVADGKVFIAVDNGSLYCYEYNSSVPFYNYGEVWNVYLGLMTDAPYRYSPMVVDNHVYQAYVNDQYTNITGRDASTGNALWDNDIHLDAILTSDIVVDDGKIYFTLGQKLHCYDGATGEKLWESSTIDTFDNDIPAISDGKLYTISSNGVVFCLDLTANGSVIWQYATGDLPTLRQDHPSIGYGNLYICVNKKLYCFSLSTHMPVWIYPSTNDNVIYYPLVADGKVIIVVRQQGLKCLNAYNGTIIWKYDDSTIQDYPPAVAYGILFCTGRGTVYAFYENHPPNTPDVPEGPITGFTGDNITFSTSTTDTEEDQVWYQWKFGSETTDWIGPFDSGIEISQSHIWTSPGTYDIKVTAKDIYEQQTVWSPTTTITIHPPPPSLSITTPESVIEGNEFDVVVTANEIPIKDASVEFNENIYTTDITGIVTLTAPQVDEHTPYIITANQAGYTSATKTITVLNQQYQKENYGWLYGIVSDKEGNLLPDANVCIYASDDPLGATKYCVITDDQGRYIISYQAGTYTLEASEQGYTAQIKTDILIQEKNAFEVNFNLETNQAAPPNHEQQLIDQAILEGNISGMVQFQPEANTIRYTSIIYISDVQVSITAIEKARISLSVGSENPLGTTIIFDLASGVFASEKIGILVDGNTIQKADSFEDVLNPTDDTTLEWYIQEKPTKDGSWLLLSIPHFSEYHITIYQIIETVSKILLGALYGSVVIIGVATVIYLIVFSGTLRFLKKKMK